ncbi:BTB/POZ protein [Gigaspora rosea]|uniref:BTB/POZ protein n=1 Tax=Gigaspora rosea TaxID=44941 RepID=A0A397W9P1_9GLOM|nr:BTB/POZ protein [Gigaspora rosea]
MYSLHWHQKIAKIHNSNNNNNKDSRLRQFRGCSFDILIEKLLKFENSQAHIIFIQVPINTTEEKIILNIDGKKYETFKSILTAQPKTLLGTMFQDRNKCMRHPINGNEYFFDRNSEAFYYIMEFYRTGRLIWPNESGKVTCKQLEEELDYFQKSLLINRQFTNVFCSSKFMYYETRVILDNMGKYIEKHLVKRFSDLGLKYESGQNSSGLPLITISFSFENIYKNF